MLFIICKILSYILLLISVKDENEERSPKALSSNKSVDIQISNAVDDEIIIIDLTSNKETKNEEALITGEEKEPQSLLISFDSPFN